MQRSAGPRSSQGWSVLLLIVSALATVRATRVPLYVALRAARHPAPLAREDAKRSLAVGERAQDYWTGIREFTGAFKIPKLHEDDLPEAVSLNRAMETAKVEPASVSFGELASLTAAYYSACSTRTFAKPEVKDRMPDVFALGNVVLIGLILRLALPRLLAIQSMDDFYDFAPQLGLPTRPELISYAEYARSMDYATKLALFLLIIIVEKVTLVGEILPVGIILPAISPLVTARHRILGRCCVRCGTAALLLSPCQRERDLPSSCPKRGSSSAACSKAPSSRRRVPRSALRSTS